MPSPSNNAELAYARMRRRSLPPTTMRCLNPTCTNTCTWSSAGAGGRQPLYCCHQCRVDTARIRKKLENDLDDAESILQATGPDGIDRDWVRKRALQTRWALRHYPDVHTDLSVTRWVPPRR